MSAKIFDERIEELQEREMSVRAMNKARYGHIENFSSNHVPITEELCL